MAGSWSELGRGVQLPWHQTERAVEDRPGEKGSAPLRIPGRSLSLQTELLTVNLYKVYVTKLWL